MKKLISILATLAMVLSVTSSVIPTVFAEGETTYYSPTEVSVVGGYDATGITEPVYGMVSVDGVKKYTPRNDESKPTYHAGFIYKDATAFKETQAANYVVFETDFAGNTIQKISVCKSGSGDATAKLTSGWADNRWNTLRIVYETPTDEYKKGRAAFYINGQVVKNFTANTSKFDDQYRVSFLFNNNEGTLYVKNYRMYASDTNPGADGTAIDATLVKNGLTVSANRIIAPQNVAVNSLTASNDAAIRVYSNADYTTQLAGEDIISSGNIVVLEKDGKLDYYSVVDSVDPVYYKPDSIGVVGGRDAIAATAPVYGMATADGVMQYIPRDDAQDRDYHAGFIWNAAAKIATASDLKYVIFDTDFAGKDIKEISVCKSGQGKVTTKLKSGWIEGQWNSLRIVCENPTDEYPKGRTAFYINGKLVKGYTANTDVFNEYRLSFLFNDTEGELYVKNYSMCCAFTDPGAEGTGFSGTITNDGLNIIDKKIVAPVDVTAGSLTVADDAKVRVYSNSTYTTQLSAEDVIGIGNMVVIEKGDKLDYYEVTGDLTTIIYDAKSQPEWTVNVFTAKDDVTAYGGKASGDTSKYYELPAESEAGSLQFFYPLSYHYRYVVAKYSFYFDNDETITGTLVTTGGNNESSVVRNKNIKSGEWNNVIVWIDTQESMSKVYLNGALLQNWTKKDKQFLSDDTDTKKYFRLRFEGTADGAVRTFAVDDFEMYTTTALPEIEKDYKSLSGSYITATGEAFYKSGATVDSILADTKYQADGATAVIYDTATGAAVTTGDLPATAKLALRTDDSTIKSYDLIAVDGIKAWDNGARSKNGFAFADSGVLIAARYVGGKFISVKLVSVENGMAKAQMNYTGEDGEKVKFMLWNSLSGMDPIYKAVVAQ